MVKRSMSKVTQFHSSIICYKKCARIIQKKKERVRDTETFHIRHYFCTWTSCKTSRSSSRAVTKPEVLEFEILNTNHRNTHRPFNYFKTDTCSYFIFQMALHVMYDMNYFPVFVFCVVVVVVFFSL